MVEKRKPGRPKGSSNKPKVELKRNKNGSAVINVKMERQVEGTPINRVSGLGYVRWGTDNRYPKKLAELYFQGVTHKSCIDFAVNAILGEGIDYDAMEVNESELTPNYIQTWDDILENITKDYLIYGGFAMQIIKNNDDKTFSFFHEPFGNVRFGEKNEDGVIENYYISSDWEQTGLYPPVELKSFSFMEEEEIIGGEAYLYVYTKYEPHIDYYPTPHYISALKSIMAEIELQRYDLRSILNNFSASGILTLNRVDDEEEKQMLIEGITSMLTGSDNANSLVINFKNNDDESPATFVQINKDSNSTVDLFSETNNRVAEKILVAHKITNKSLIGYPNEGASLGGDGNVMNVAFNLYNNIFSNKVRKTIVRSINNALKMNGVDTQLILKPLKFDLTSTVKVTDTEVDSVDRNEDSEKATSENNNSNLD